MAKAIEGNQCLIVTPLREDETVDVPSTRRLLDFVIDGGVDGVLAQGSTGEGFLFTTEERKAFMDLVVRHVGGRVPVGFDIESPSTMISVDLARYAKQAGVDYLFTTPPYRHPHKGPGIFEHFKAINDATDLPVAIYDGGAGIELDIGFLVRVSRELRNVRFCKVFLEKPEKIAQIEKACEGRLEPWAGHDRLTYLMLLYGARGMTSAASCVIPGENTRMLRLVREGRIDEARQIYLAKVAPLNAIAFATVLDYIAAYKLALHWMGVIDTPTVRRPLVQLDEIMQRELKAALRFIGIEAESK